ncbi:hypothetical protein BDQ17DRAFT_1323106 [Cyathus striatus]|nr:hypothetical protein BDQ17DRAFT_1323106 [Cyathus striatus]
MSYLRALPLETLHGLLKPITVLLQSSASCLKIWARTSESQPTFKVFEPRTEFQCQIISEVARREGKSVRAVGMCHSSSDTAYIDRFILRMTKLNKVLKINSNEKFVVAEGGISVYDLETRLAKRNLAIRSLGSISNQTLAGAIFAATHDSGVNRSVFSAQVLEFAVLLTDGRKMKCTRAKSPDIFMTILCGLGDTDIILTARLQVEFIVCRIKGRVIFANAMRNFAINVKLWWRSNCGSRTSQPQSSVTTSCWWRVLMVLSVARYSAASFHEKQAVPYNIPKSVSENDSKRYNCNFVLKYELLMSVPWVTS